MAKLKVKEKKDRFVLKLSIICLLGILTGFFVGSYYVNNIMETNFEFEYTEAEFIVSAVSISKIEAKANGNTPLALTATENFVLAEQRLKNAQTVKVISNGQVNTIVSQTVFAQTYFDGTKYLTEQISSSSMAKVAKRAVYDTTTGVVSRYQGNVIDATTAEWNSEPTNMTYDEYTALCGVRIDGFISYIVSNKTTINKTEVTEITLDNGQKGYSFSLELEPNYSVMNYREQMKEMSGMGYPTFTSVKLNVVIDSNWNFVTIQNEESYSIKAFGIKAECKGTMTQVYTYNEPVTLPTI